MKGTGLGSPIARQNAIAHGGEVSIRGTPGVGTTVEVCLPALVGLSAAEAATD